MLMVTRSRRGIVKAWKEGTIGGQGRIRTKKVLVWQAKSVARFGAGACCCGCVVDFRTIRDAKASPTARSGATVSFVVKIIVVAVIGYVVLQEFSQLRSATVRARAEACAAEQDAMLKSMPGSLSGPVYERWANRQAQVMRDCAEN